MSLPSLFEVLPRSNRSFSGWAALALATLAACSSSGTQGNKPQDPGVAAPDAGQGVDETAVNPYGVAYPTKNLGYQPRRGSSPGNVIRNYKFIGYVDGDISQGLKPVSLADYFDPEMRQYKILHISVGGTWCSACREEERAVTPALPRLKANKVAYLFALTHGAAVGQPATEADLDTWMKTFKSPSTHVLDSGGQNLGPFFDAAALPFNADIDTRTMEILSGSAGAVDIEATTAGWVKWVDANPIEM